MAFADPPCVLTQQQFRLRTRSLVVIPNESEEKAMRRPSVVGRFASVRGLLLPLMGAIMSGLGVTDAEAVPSFRVTGRLAVSEPHSCDGGGGSGDLTTNETLTWTQCHAIKQHMDAAGNPITSNAFDAAALRPLSVTVRIESRCYYAGATASDLYPRATVSVQTDERGNFSATIPATTCPRSAEGVQTIASASLAYEMKSNAGPLRIRAIWDRALGQTVYNSVQSGSEPTLFSAQGVDYVIPRLLLGYNLLPFPLAPTLDLGNQTFFDGAAPYYYDYLRAALGTWQTTVRLHQLLRSRLIAEGAAKLYEKMFITDPPFSCDRCYTLGFTNAFGGGVGGLAFYAVERPNASNVPYANLVSVGLPAHEFGHTIHAGIAPGSFNGWYGYDNSMFATQTPQGVVSAFHALYTGAWGTLQQQELGIALVEGFANAMASCFVMDCEIQGRYWGNPDPRFAAWNPENFAWCDGYSDCPYGAFRYQMLRRGIPENSPTWKWRLKTLGQLADDAFAQNAIVVTSNNETKLMSFFSDLLDRNPDVSFATNQVGGKAYVPDLMWRAAEILDGRTPSAKATTYASDPAPEYVSLGWSQLLTALDEFPVGLSQLPGPLWAQPTIVDGANQAYNDGRISVNGVLSPQSLGLHMVNRGYLTLEELNSILRANLMEEVP